MVLVLGGFGALPGETASGPERATEGAASQVGWSYLHFHARRLMVGEIDAYVSVSSIPAEAVSPPRPAQWSERLPPRQEVLLVSVETRLDPTFGPPLRLVDRSWLVADSLPGRKPRAGSTPLLALWQVRSQEGGDEYEKTYWFTRDGVHRLRKTPATSEESGRAPERWSDLRRSFYPYSGGGRDCTGVGTPVALLLLSSRRDRPDPETLRHMCIFDRKELYDVRIGQAAAGLADFDVGGVKGYPPGRPRVAGLAFEPRSLRGADGKEFSFLGISGDFEVVFDLDNGIPLRIKGSVPGLGATELALQEVRLSRARPSRPREPVR